MARKPEQEVLAGIPGPAKRKVIKEIEDLCEASEKNEGKRSKLGDEHEEINVAIQTALVEHGIKIYTYEDGNGVMQDIMLDEVIRRRRSKVQPGEKPAKKEAA